MKYAQQVYINTGKNITYLIIFKTSVSEKQKSIKDLYSTAC
jgi:hypothetical protein